MFRQTTKTVAFGTALTLSLTGAAFAQTSDPADQTAAGTLIENTISLTYNSGEGTDEVSQDEAASVEFRVDRKIDVVVTAQAANGIVNVVPGQDAVILPFLVENNGNDTQGFQIDVGQEGEIGDGGLTYSATATTDEGTYYVSISDTQAIDPEDIYDVPTAASARDVASGESFYVLIVANIPINAADEELNDFLVAAITTDEGTATPAVEERSEDLTELSTVFADAATNSSRRADVEISAEFDGLDADETRILLTAPVIVAGKSAVVLDEGLPGTNFDCADGGDVPSSALAAIPGACIEYTITVTNNSETDTAATDIFITDELPDGITFAGLTEGEFDAEENGGVIQAELDELEAGGTETFTIRALVD